MTRSQEQGNTEQRNREILLEEKVVDHSKITIPIRGRGEGGKEGGGKERGREEREGEEEKGRGEGREGKRQRGREGKNSNSSQL